MTKEELLKKVAILEEDNKRLGLQEKELRMDISKVLDNTRIIHERYSNERRTEVVLYSWAEIFAEIGKLIALKRESMNAEYINSQEGRLQNIERSLENICINETD